MNTTQEIFNEVWRTMHPGMDIEAELPYYWKVYSELRDACGADESDPAVRIRIYCLLLYIEDMAGLKLGDAFMKEYRIAADFLPMTVQSFGLDEDAAADVQIIVYQAIKNAPDSGLRRYIRDVFTHDDFSKLCDAMLWVTTYNQPLMTIMPNKLLCRNYLDEEICCDNDTEGRYDRLADLWLAFCWTDKQGKSIADHLEHCFDEDKELEPIAFLLFDIDTTDVNKFKVKHLRKGKAEIAGPKDSCNFIFEIDQPQPLPKDFRKRYLLGMVVCWRDMQYLCEPYFWITAEEADRFDAYEFITDFCFYTGLFEQDEKITLSTGEQLFKYEDVACEESFSWIGKFDTKPVMENMDEYDLKIAMAKSAIPSLSEFLEKWESGNEPVEYKMPNYKYRPKGKNPEKYFERKIGEVRAMETFVDDSSVAMTIYEGWLRQAHTYHSNNELRFARAIVSALLWEASEFYDDAQYDCDCRSRVSKIVRECWKLWLEILKVGPVAWVLEAIDFLLELRYGCFDLFDPRAPFSIEKALRDVRKITKQTEK